jgi:hypothetical protein
MCLQIFVKVFCLNHVKTDMSKGWRRGDYQKGHWNGDHQRKGKEADPNIPARRGLKE